jgi:hypothetical protein
VKTLSIEVGTVESAHDLWSSLAPFDAVLTEVAAEEFVVTVDVSDCRADIVSVLNAIHRYVTSRQAGPATIDLDGRTFMMDAL